MIRIKIKINLVIFATHISDYKCGEFHITPVITLSWPNKDIKSKADNGLALAFEWGFWALCVGYAYNKLPTK